MEDDCYTVENSVWAIGEIGTDDPAILEEMAQLLVKSGQSYRVIIQTLAKLGYRAAVDRIKPFIDHKDGPIASAAITAVSRLTDNIQMMEQVLPFLEHASVYTRRLCIQDLMDAEYYQSIPFIARCPVSLVFRLRGIRFLSRLAISKELLPIKEAQRYIEMVLWDHPSTLSMVHEYDQPPTVEFLVRELYETDFGRCYLATQTLLKHHQEMAPLLLMKSYKDAAYDDYGANYHILKVLGWLKYAPAYELFLEALNRKEPQFQKSRTAAAIALAQCHDLNITTDFKECIFSQIWSLKYAVLAVL